MKTKIDMRSRYRPRINGREYPTDFVRFASAVQAAREAERTATALDAIDIVRYAVEPTGLTPTDFHRVSRAVVVWRSDTPGSYLAGHWRRLVMIVAVVLLAVGFVAYPASAPLWSRAVVGLVLLAGIVQSFYPWENGDDD